MSVVDNIPRFGVFDPTVEYELRPGGYAIARNERGELLTVSTPKGIFLPGGAQEDGETPEAAAIRETEEECGLRIRIDRFIGIADELTWSKSEARHFRKRCTFFTEKVIGEGVASEGDHELRPLSLDEALRQLSHESQVWAVRRMEDRFFEEG